MSNDKVRLHQSPGERASYIALSHCWGNTHNQVKTLKSNIQKRKHEICWDELNQSYKDAISLTRRLGFNFLWIDSLCIVQDDPDDWEQQSARMSSIYENSFLTICATRAKDGDSGLFCDRRSLKTAKIWKRPMLDL